MEIISMSLVQLLRHCDCILLSSTGSDNTPCIKLINCRPKETGDGFQLLPPGSVLSLYPRTTTVLAGATPLVASVVALGTSDTQTSKASPTTRAMTAKHGKGDTKARITKFKANSKNGKKRGKAKKVCAKNAAKKAQLAENKAIASQFPELYEEILEEEYDGSDTRNVIQNPSLKQIEAVKNAMKKSTGNTIYYERQPNTDGSTISIPTVHYRVFPANFNPDSLETSIMSTIKTAAGENYEHIMKSLAQGRMIMLTQGNAKAHDIEDALSMVSLTEKQQQSYMLEKECGDEFSFVGRKFKIATYDKMAIEQERVKLFQYLGDPGPMMHDLDPMMPVIEELSATNDLELHLRII